MLGVRRASVLLRAASRAASRSSSRAAAATAGRRVATLYSPLLRGASVHAPVRCISTMPSVLEQAAAATEAAAKVGIPYNELTIGVPKEVHRHTPAQHSAYTHHSV